MCHHPGYDSLYDDDWAHVPDVEPYDDEPSLSWIALAFDTGRTCGECGAEFTKANGEPSSCEFCKRRGSEYPLSKHPEKNKEAHKAVARRRRKQKAQRREKGD